MFRKACIWAFVQTENLKERGRKLGTSSERGEWLGSLAWTGVYGIGAIAVALVVAAALTALGGRVGTSIGNVTG